MSNTAAPGVNPQIQNADVDSAANKKIQGDVEVHHGVEVVEKERAAIGRTWSRTGVNVQLPNQRLKT